MGKSKMNPQELYLNNRINYVLGRLCKLEDFVQEQFMIPKMRILIMEIMKHENNLTEADLQLKVEEHLHEKGNSEEYSTYLKIACVRTFDRLVKEKVLIPKSYGRGHPRTWKYLTYEEWNGLKITSNSKVDYGSG